MTSALNLVIPDLVPRMFDPEYVPPHEGPVDTEGIWFPSTEDEFDQMLAEFEAQDAAMRSKQVFDALQGES